MNNSIEVRFINNTKGRGVFAKKPFKKGTIIDESHVILLTQEEFDMISSCKLYNYSFEWKNPDDKENICAIAMSFCQFINHSYTPNIMYEYDYENETIIYTVIEDIRQGEEITVNYNGDVEDKSPVWFEVE